MTAKWGIAGTARVGLIVLLFFIIGVARSYVNTFFTALPEPVTTTKVLVGYVKEVKVAGGKQFLTLTSLHARYNDVNLITSSYPRYKLGQVLEVRGDFNGKRFVFPDIRVGCAKKVPLNVWILRVRQSIIDKAAHVLPQPYLGIVMGVVFGIKDALLESTNDLFRDAGIIHMLVASGYNISVLIAFVSSATSFLTRRLRMLVILAFVFFYAALSGFEPPIIRASIMGGATLLAMSVGRQKLSFIWLIYSAILMLLVSPTILSSVSFQLSFAATLAIILFNTRLEKLLVLIPSVIRTDLATTISAQLLTTPIIWWYFGRIQPLSILINSLVLWSVPIVMLFGALCVGISYVYMPIAKLFALVAVMLIDYVLAIARGLSF